MSQTNRMTDVHPANSPYNTLTASQLEDLLRTWKYRMIPIHRTLPPLVRYEPPRYLKRVEPLEKEKER